MSHNRSIALDISNLTKTYRLEHKRGELFKALNNISLTVQKGEVIGIIGNNGSGKSTLLKVLSQITRPSSGSVSFYGSVTSILEIGTNFHPDLTGRQNVELHLRLTGLPAAQFAARMQQVAQFSEIGEFFDQPVKVYSSGMFLRLAFSMAFHLESDIILLDEVLTVGDEGFRLKCQDMLRSITAQGKTILFVSHNRLEILELAHRCVWLEKGRIRKIGPAPTILSEYFALHRDNYDEQKNIVETHQPEFAHTENADGTVDIQWSEDKAPGNEVISIRRLTVSNATGKGPLLSHQPIQVTFVMHKKVACVQMGAFFFLQDVFYQPVMVAHFLNNTTQTDWGQVLKEQTGLFTITCTLPANFLVPGKYYLLPRFGMEQEEWNISSQEVFRFSEKLHFTLHGAPGYSDLIGDISKGAVRPALQWEISYVTVGF